MNKFRLIKISSILALTISVSACSMFGGGKIKNSAKAYNTPTNPAPLVRSSNPSLGDNKLNIYFGNQQKPVAVKTLTKSKAKGKSKAKVKEEKVVASNGETITVEGINYYTSATSLNKMDVKNVFVAKTDLDKPALGLRLTPTGVAKVNQASRGHYNVLLASMNGSIFSRVSGIESNLTDSVLLLPMPTLVSARDAADMLR